MLQMSCKNADFCMALGPYDQAIKLFFDDFHNLTDIDNTAVQKIGNSSANAFLLQLPFQRQHYKAFTALKSTSRPDADNLVYEYLVGTLFINRFVKQLPCFVETLGLFKYNSLRSYNLAKTTNPLKHNMDTLIKRVTNLSFDYLLKESCKFQQFYCILLQHFDHFTSLGNAMDKRMVTMSEVIYAMYQAYFGLCVLGRNYTHYDFHADNLQLYKPFGDDDSRCILMRYHRDGDAVVVEFKCKYVAKIIDYGRNYFNNGVQSTPSIVQQMCDITDCQPQCGINVGYRNIQGNILTSTSTTEDPDENNYWVNPMQPNMSHDLRMALEIRNWLLTNRFHRIDNFVYASEYGSPEVLDEETNVVSTVFSLRNALESIIAAMKGITNLCKVAAIMDVYDDGREYTFELLPDEEISSSPITGIKRRFEKV